LWVGLQADAFLLSVSKGVGLKADPQKKIHKVILMCSYSHQFVACLEERLFTSQVAGMARSYSLIQVTSALPELF
jgi:hypothetical protein